MIELKKINILDIFFSLSRTKLITQKKNILNFIFYGTSEHVSKIGFLKKKIVI